MPQQLMGLELHPLFTDYSERRHLFTSSAAAALARAATSGTRPTALRNHPAAPAMFILSVQLVVKRTFGTKWRTLLVCKKELGALLS